MDEDIRFRLKERSPLAILNDLSVDTDVVGMVKKILASLDNLGYRNLFSLQYSKTLRSSSKDSEGSSRNCHISLSTESIGEERDACSICLLNC
jgi:hypothetical protein